MALAGIMRTVDLWILDIQHMARCDHDLPEEVNHTLLHTQKHGFLLHSGIGGWGCTLGLWACRGNWLHLLCGCTRFLRLSQSRLTQCLPLVDMCSSPTWCRGSPHCKVQGVLVVRDFQQVQVVRQVLESRLFQEDHLFLEAFQETHCCHYLCYPNPLTS